MTAMVINGVEGMRADIVAGLKVGVETKRGGGGRKVLSVDELNAIRNQHFHNNVRTYVYLCNVLLKEQRRRKEE